MAFFKLSIFVSCLCVALVASKSEVKESSNMLRASALVQNPQQAAKLSVCIDDSDCQALGANYACFQYICYPYQNDDVIRKDLKKRKCTRNEDCGPKEACHRHHDIRNINVGLCMDDFGDCRDNGEADCKGQGQDKCCNGQFCCESKYFNDLTKLPCLNNLMCKDLGYGDYCCPQKGNNTTKVCCDTNPNPPPPPTMAPKVDSLSGASTTFAASLLLAVIPLFALLP